MNGYQYRAYVSGGSCSDTSCSAFLFVSATQPILTTIGVDSACSNAIAMPVNVEEFYLVGSFSLGNIIFHKKNATITHTMDLSYETLQNARESFPVWMDADVDANSIDATHSISEKLSAVYPPLEG